MSASIAYRVLFVIPSALPVIPSEVEESLHHRPEGRALRPFIWGHDGAGSSSGTTTAFSIPSINIGSATYTQDSAEGQGKKHIAGGQFPMFGFVNDLDMDESPDITMNHLAAIAAVKVVNLTDDIITLNNAELHTYKTVVENNKSVKKTLPVVGNFKVGFDNDGNPIEFTAVSGNSNQVKIQLDEPVPVKPNASYTLYFAVSPFKTTLQNLTLYINGSEKIPVSADEVEFEAGKITTLKLEVNPLSTPLDNDALGYTFTGRKYRENGDITKNVVTFYNVENGQYVKITEPTATVNINNSQVPIYVLGGDKTSIIRIEGKGSDLVNVLPVTFYASRWNDKPTAMRLKKVDAYWKAMISKDWLSAGTFSKLDGILGIELDDGITPDDLAALGFGTSKLTFSGMIPNCSFNGDDIANSNVLMIDEERTSKVFDNAAGGNIETYLKIAGNSATMEGLIDIFNGNLSSSAAKSTGQALYDFIYAKIKNKVDSEFVTSSAMSIIGVSSSSALMQRLRDTQFYVEIETCPFPGHTDQNPIVVWGFDANIPTSPN